jgi:hypothetical protein
MVVVYPVGIPALYFYLLYRNRHRIMYGTPDKELRRRSLKRGEELSGEEVQECLQELHQAEKRASLGGGEQYHSVERVDRDDDNDRNEVEVEVEGGDGGERRNDDVVLVVDEESGSLRNEPVSRQLDGNQQLHSVVGARDGGEEGKTEEQLRQQQHRQPGADVGADTGAGSGFGTGAKVDHEDVRPSPMRGGGPRARILLRQGRLVIARIRRRSLPMPIHMPSLTDYITPKELFFLHQAYEPQYWYWEIIETARRLFLTAVMSIVATGTKLFVADNVIHIL